MVEEGIQQVRSLRCDKEIYLRFINKSKRTVNIFWLDFNGHPVNYCTLNPDRYYDVNTFESHPWIFEDSQTRDRLVVCNQYVFYPPNWSELYKKKFPDAENIPAHRLVVMITIPVYSLRERCLQVVRDNLDSMISGQLDGVHDLQLPKTVTDDLIIMVLRKDGFYL